jgi:hypothetical protein
MALGSRGLRIARKRCMADTRRGTFGGTVRSGSPGEVGGGSDSRPRQSPSMPRVVQPGQSQSAILARATATISSSISVARHLRPVFLQASAIVPVPENGSPMSAPGAVRPVIHFTNGARGCCQSCHSFMDSRPFTVVTSLTIANGFGWPCENSNCFASVESGRLLHSG